MTAAPRDTAFVGGIARTTFAGRDAELDTLSSTLLALETSGARTVLVGGEAGIGKTRLVEEFRDHARAAGALVAVGVCTPVERGALPYAPVVGALRDLAGQLDDARSALLVPARRALGLVDTTEERDDADVRGALAKTRLFETLLQTLTALAERSRAVIAFEDLHWADSATLEFVDFLTRNLHQHPLLLVGTYRTDELAADGALAHVRAELQRHRAVTEIELTGLDRDATAALMAGIVGRQPEWSLVDAVHGRSDGNPFFVEELTACRDATTLPSLLRNVIMVRVDRLSPEARQVVAVVATAGDAIDRQLLANAANLDDPMLRDAVAEAVERGVLVADGGSGFAFRHALQRDAIYDALLPTERAHLHERLAVALTKHPELRAVGPCHAAAELASHWWEAGRWDEALPAAVAAGDAMAAMFAMPEAAALYDRALAASERVTPTMRPDETEIVDLLERAADASYFTGALEHARDLAQSALDRVDPVEDRRRAAHCQARVARHMFVLGETEAAFRAFDSAGALLADDAPTAELAGILAQQARCLLLLSRFSETQTLCRKAIAVADAANARAEGAHALDTLGIVLGIMGRIDEGLEAVRRALVVAEELKNPDNLNLGYTHLSLLLILKGDLEAAADVTMDGAAMGEALGGLRLNGAAINSAEALIALGRFDEAEALLGDLGDLVGNCVISPPMLHGVIALRRGRYDDADRWLDIVDAMSAHLSDVQFRAAYHMLRATVALEQGRVTAGSAEIERALPLVLGTEDTTIVELAALAVRASADQLDDARANRRRLDVDKLRLNASALLEAAERMVGAPLAHGGVRLPESVAFLATARAEESRLTASEPDLWREAAERWDEMRRPYDGAYCRWREVEGVLARRSSRRGVTERLDEAWTRCGEIGATGLGEKIEQLARRARITLSTADSGETQSPARRIAEDLQLTPREVEVLTQLARGRTDKQIADELFISRKTASVHVSNILRKLDASNRAEAGEIGQRVGLGQR